MATKDLNESRFKFDDGIDTEEFYTQNKHLLYIHKSKLNKEDKQRKDDMIRLCFFKSYNERRMKEYDKDTIVQRMFIKDLIKFKSYQKSYQKSKPNE